MIWRKEKGMTQEVLSEKLNVTRRTVSRWETGSNMPDIDILIELSDLYGVGLREILNGERNDTMMDKETKETVLMAADYSNEENRRSTKVVCIYFVLGIIGLFINLALNASELPDTFLTGFFKGMTFSLPCVAMGLGLIYTTGKMAKIRAFKERITGKRTREENA